MGAPLRVAVLGAGGVGGVYGAALAKAGHPVSFLARGTHLEAIRARGLEARTPEGSYVVRTPATDDPAELGPHDLALVCVKTYALESVVPAARLLAEAGATVVPLLNGVDAADRLVAGGVPQASVLGGLAAVSAARVAPGVVERKSPFRSAIVGELAGGLSPRAEAIAAALRGAGIDAKASPDITAELWKKLAFIAAMAASCGLSRSPIGPVREAPFGRLLLERAVREAYAVARAKGVAVGEEDAKKTLAFVDGLGAGMKPSFLLDLEAGGPNELDDLCGAVARFGRALGVETPIHDTAVAALSAFSAVRGAR